MPVCRGLRRIPVFSMEPSEDGTGIVMTIGDRNASAGASCQSDVMVMKLPFAMFWKTG
jgi:hypothetical protein